MRRAARVKSMAEIPEWLEVWLREPDNQKKYIQPTLTEFIEIMKQLGEHGKQRRKRAQSRKTKR